MQGRTVIEELIKRLSNQSESETIEIFLRTLLNKSIGKNITNSEESGSIGTLSSGLFITIPNLTNSQYDTIFTWLKATCGEKNVQPDGYAYPAGNDAAEFGNQALLSFRCYIPANVFLEKLIDPFFPKPNYQAHNPQRLHTNQNAESNKSEQAKKSRCGLI